MTVEVFPAHFVQAQISNNAKELDAPQMSHYLLQHQYYIVFEVAPVGKRHTCLLQAVSSLPLTYTFAITRTNYH
jgi:hypothetical protein